MTNLPKFLNIKASNRIAASSNTMGFIDVYADSEEDALAELRELIAADDLDEDGIVFMRLSEKAARNEDELDALSYTVEDGIVLSAEESEQYREYLDEVCNCKSYWEREIAYEKRAEKERRAKSYELRQQISEKMMTFEKLKAEISDLEDEFTNLNICPAGVPKSKRIYDKILNLIDDENAYVSKNGNLCHKKWGNLYSDVPNRLSLQERRESGLFNI